MSSDRDAIRRLVQRLVLRERVLLGASVAAQGLVLLLLGALGFAAGPLLDLDRATLAGALVLTLGVGSFVGVGAPLIAGWVRAGDPLRQARLLERIRPSIEGRLITLAERFSGARPNESAAILDLAARRANLSLRGLSDDAVHRAWPLLPRIAVIGPIFLATLLTWVLVPAGPLGVVRWWAAGAGANGAITGDERGDIADLARVGDLVLVYVYPTYTRLEPLEVANSTGEVHGPPGTRVEVRVRSADPVDSAALVAYGEAVPDTRVEEGRRVVSSFTIGDEAGFWRIDLLRGETSRSSRDFPIQPEPDLVPQVLLDSPTQLRVALDQPIVIPWLARDDYGLTQVSLVLDGRSAEVLRELASEAESSGTLSVTPQDLGMSSGMSVSLQIGALDNNGWSGPQLGLSAPIRIIVGDPEDLASLSPEGRRELRGVLVDLLAGQLLDPWPPGSTSAQVAAAGERFDALYRGLRAHMEDTPEVMTDKFVRRLLSKVVQAGQDYVIHTQVHFDPRLSDAVVDDEALAAADELRQSAVAENEQTILLLDRYDQSLALQEVLATTKQLADLGERLNQEIARGATPQEIASALERVERSLAILEKGVSVLSEDGLKSMIQGRARELTLLEKEVRAATARNDEAESNRLADRLARQLKELRDDIEYRMRRLEEEEEDLGQEVKRLLEELTRMEREQRQLQAEVRSMRESGDAQGAAEAEQMWAEVERLAVQAVERGEPILEGAGRSFYIQERVRGALSSTKRLQEAAASRDLRRAKDEVEAAIQGWGRVARAVPESARAPVVQRLEQAQRLLDRLQDEADSVDPATAAQARALRGEQGELEAALEAASRMAKEVAAKLPIEPRGMEEALREGQSSMSQAAGDLGAGRPMPAEGSQGQAAERLREAREALEEALQQMAQSGAGAGKGQNEGNESGEGEAGQEGSQDKLDLEASPWSSRKLEIEDEFDLDAFQRDVLRGMQGDVPESYRALKKRYYEELMTQ